MWSLSKIWKIKENPISLASVKGTRFFQLSKQGKITGPITLDENGHRQYFNIRIMDVRPGESVQTGYWDPDGLHSIDNEEERESYLYKSIELKKFKITTKVVCIFHFNINFSEQS